MEPLEHGRLTVSPASTNLALSSLRAVDLTAALPDRQFAHPIGRAGADIAGKVHTEEWMRRLSPEMAHLCRIDPVMKGLIAEVGPYALPSPARRSPFESLVRAIAYQQLHAKAAECILARFMALCPGRRFPQPSDVLALEPERIREAGFSRAKVAALQDLAVKAIDGTVPTAAVIRRLEDDAIVERLMAVRGIGRWTVEMLLIFQLGRPDVLPVDDFGVRNGFRIAYKKAVMPTPQELLRYGERWRPYRTAAAWYLWRAVDQAKAMRTAALLSKPSTRRISNGRPA